MRKAPPHRRNAVARLCFVVRFAPFFLLTDFSFFFALSSFFHISHILSRQWGSMAVSTRRVSSEARTEPAAEAVRCSLEIGTLGHFWGSRCWSDLVWICGVIS